MFLRLVSAAASSALLVGCANDLHSLQYRVPAAITVEPGIGNATMRFEPVEVPGNEFLLIAGTGQFDRFVRRGGAVVECPPCAGTIEDLPTGVPLTFVIILHPSEKLHFQPVTDVELGASAGVDVADDVATVLSATNATVATGISFTGTADECRIDWGDGTIEPPLTNCDGPTLAATTHAYADGTYLLRARIGTPGQVESVVQVPVCVGPPSIQDHCTPL